MSSKPCIPVRFVIVMLTVFGGALMYGHRYNMSIAIIAMANVTSVQNISEDSGVTIVDLSDTCPFPESYNLSESSVSQVNISRTNLAAHLIYL